MATSSPSALSAGMELLVRGLSDSYRRATAQVDALSAQCKLEIHHDVSESPKRTISREMSTYGAGAHGSRPTRTSTSRRLRARKEQAVSLGAKRREIARRRLERIRLVRVIANNGRP